MSSQIFRKASMDRVSSPEQLNSYIRVASPGVWLVLAAIALLLVGVCVWGVLGQLDTTLPVAAVAAEDGVRVYIQAEDVAKVQAGMTVRIGDAEFTLAQISQEPMAVDNSFSAYTLYVGALSQGQWVYTGVLSGAQIANGVYEAQIVVESVSPMSFVTN